MSELTSAEEKLGADTADFGNPDLGGTTAKAPRKRRLWLILAAAGVLVVVVGLLTMMLGRDNGRAVTLMLIDKTSENPLPTDLTVAIANDAPQYPKMAGKRAILDLGHVGSPGKRLTITVSTPSKSKVRFVFPKKLPSRDLVIALSLGDNKITGRLAHTTATVPRKNPVAAARQYAEEELTRLAGSSMSSEEGRQLETAKREYAAIWGGRASAPWSRIAQRINDLVLPAYRANAQWWSAQSSDSPTAAKWLSANQKCHDMRSETKYREWVRASRDGDDSGYADARNRSETACLLSGAAIYEIMPSLR